MKPTGPYRANRYLPLAMRPRRAPDGHWYSYAHRAAALPLPHGPDHDCLVCADARAALGHRPLDPDPELTAIAARILDRARWRDETRYRPALDVGILLAPTLMASAGVGALLGMTSALYVLTGGIW